jgi:peptide-methionine (R)-S-oxide reductase
MPLAVRDYPELAVATGTKRVLPPACAPRWCAAGILLAMSAHDHDDRRYPVRKSDAEWRSQLDRMQYEVTRHAATERAFTGKYHDHFQDGKYLCVGCGTPLFESSAKFDAGCGWPSYWEPVNSEVVERIEDQSHGMVRVEVRCNKCGSHLGHVFPDGPEPTGERFCINSAAIDFKAGSE